MKDVLARVGSFDLLVSLQSGGCNFIGWFEGPVDGFVQGLLVDLRDAVWSLQREKAELKAALLDAVMKIEQQKKELSALAVAKEEDDLRLRVQKLRKQRLWMFVLLVSFVVAVFVRLC